MNDLLFPFFFLVSVYYMFITCMQVVYILDQVRALEEELVLRIKQQGLSVKPHILVVSCFEDRRIKTYTRKEYISKNYM